MDCIACPPRTQTPRRLGRKPEVYLGFAVTPYEQRRGWDSNPRCSCFTKIQHSFRQMDQATDCATRRMTQGVGIKSRLDRNSSATGEHDLDARGPRDGLTHLDRKKSDGLLLLPFQSAPPPIEAPGRKILTLSKRSDTQATALPTRQSSPPKLFLASITAPADVLRPPQNLEAIVTWQDAVYRTLQAF
jgi:hypothetical protein